MSVVVVLLLLLLLLLVLSEGGRPAHAQTKSPTRKPTAPTVPPPPLCAVYGQLPQVLNGTGVAAGGNGAQVAVSGDGSILAVASAGANKVAIYAKPAGSPTATLYQKVTEVSPPAWMSVTLFAEAPQDGAMSMSATGDTLAVATITSDPLNLCSNNRSIVVFRATARAFAKFNASAFLQQSFDLQSDAGFGSSISVSKDGTYVAASAPSDTTPAADYGGAIVVFKLGGAGAKPWEFAPEATIRANPPASGLYLGVSVGITDNGVLVAGAVGLPDGGGMYTFARTFDGMWAQQGPVVRPDSDNFSPVLVGVSVAIDRAGLTAIVGDANDATDDVQAGAVWIVSRASRATLWSVPQRVAAPTPWKKARFGSAVALSDAGTVAAVGAPLSDPDGVVGGAATWFRLNKNAATGLWSVSSSGYASVAVLAPGAVPQTTMLGNSVSVSADASLVVVGSPNRATAAGVTTGAAEVWSCGVAP